MKAIALFGGKHIGLQTIGEEMASMLGCQFIQDDEIIRKTSERYHHPISALEEVIFQDPPTPEHFSAKKFRYITDIKAVIAEQLESGPAVFAGVLGGLIPSELAMHVLVTASMDYRMRQLFKSEGISGKAAEDRIHRDDRGFFNWTYYLEEMENVKPSRSQAFVASDTMEVSDVIHALSDEIERKGIGDEPESMDDFVLSIKLGRAFARKKIPVGIHVSNACAEITIVKPVLMLSRYERKVIRTASEVEGIKQVKVQVGPHFYKADIISNWNFTLSANQFFEMVERKYARIHDRIARFRKPIIEKRDETRLSSLR